MPSHSPRRNLWLVLLLAAGGCSGTPNGQGVAGPAANAANTHARAPQATAAQRIELDTSAAASATAAAPAVLAQFATPAEEVRLPDGTVGVKVAKQYYHTIVACRRSDGSYTTDCPQERQP